MSKFLQQLAGSRNVEGQRGIYSVCSAHPLVIEAAMRRHIYAVGPLLIEATCNQVNQFGGYTGMKPADFATLVRNIAEQTGFPPSRILLGGDHLGPFPWQNLPANEAMENACEMVSYFVRAGYRKIHLDASMPCADDPRMLSPRVIAERASHLCAAAEHATEDGELAYVVGTEVPTPGGSGEETELSVTEPEAAEEALQLHRQAFRAAGLDHAWAKVIALVVQPGVEFGNESVHDYDRSEAASLCALLARHRAIVFEAHSTDYQCPKALAALVSDGFAILKVGPGLTYAMRQALFALAAIERECVPSSSSSRLADVLERVMLQHPEYWEKHYPGTPEQQRRLRIHSYSDRIRYYWTNPEVKHAVEVLMKNLEPSAIPETLLSDYLPDQYRKFRDHELENRPLSLILDTVGNALDPYILACKA